jgi:micrococcal nuclease
MSAVILSLRWMNKLFRLPNLRSCFEKIDIRIFCTGLSLFPALCFAADFSGPAVSVLDGDTIEVLHNNLPERIRLNGIDCPEKGQPFGKKAKLFTSTLVYGKEVTIQVIRKDRHGRTVADVVLLDGANVSRELVKAGLAWWYRQYSKDESLGALEEEARQDKRGLWADPSPIPPWKFRRPNQGRAPLAYEDLLSEPIDTTPKAIIGNKNSQVFHLPGCPNYTATAPKNRVVFNSEAEAEAAGYHRAGNCPNAR